MKTTVVTLIWFKQNPISNFSTDYLLRNMKTIMTPAKTENPSKMKITHLEVELSKDAAELVLGTRKGGITNLLAVSSLGSIGKTINLKVKKGQLHIYLKAPKLEP